MINLDRTEYQNENGLADWWAKDGMWHVARPCPDPCPQTGLRTGGLRYVEEYLTREQAVAALANPVEMAN